ncbi:Type 1 glutamine amidotransferase-like domain-containing protein [Arthrobacter sp. MYb213]|uniref:Type 1 glutamine amidotransferase-like domain-containing protein n=1 Tax=Arthrobacter sp. MYb213 TaxID=1848595 RepID=UPI000CFB7F91|nr:Type 1 glutamine amidotransferase-like domain-containing protein [Arthrobacter sp. MYb213]PRB72346.1 hypothetical protein CQ011_01390 [Arthrobacter sp. MYb213]
MSIFLVGGGVPDTPAYEPILDAFLQDVLQNKSHDGQPILALALVDHAGSGQHYLPAYVIPIEARMPCQIRPIYLRLDKPADPVSFENVDGIIVCGGPTPEYLTRLRTCADTIRGAANRGIPYLGFSAGAMIASKNALIGGYFSEGIEICPEESSENLKEITLADGLGLTTFTVEVHAAQAGTLGRAVATVERNLTEMTIAIDEDTAAVVELENPENLKVLGAGHVWIVTRNAESINVELRTGS